MDSRVELALLACIEIPGQTVVVDTHRQAWLGSRRERGHDVLESLGRVEDNVRLRRSKITYIRTYVRTPDGGSVKARRSSFCGTFA